MSDAEVIRPENRNWFIALGILFIFLGIIAIGFPVLMTITAKIFLGWLFLIGGIFEIVHAFSTKDWKGFFWNLLIGILCLVVGVWLAFFPLAGIIGLTVLLALMFIGEGVMKAIMGFGLAADEGRFWVLISGIAALVVGILLLAGLPGTALWAIGLLVGINFLFSGASFLALASAAGKASGDATT